MNSDKQPMRKQPRRIVTGRRGRWLAIPELLEERRLLATLDINAGALSYLALPNTANVLTISTTGRSGSYTFSDSAETITLTPRAITAGWTGGGTHKVTGPDSSVTSISVDTRGGKDTINVLSVDAPTKLAPTNSAGDVDVIDLGNSSNGVQGLNGDVTIANSAGTTVLTVDDSADSTARTPLVSGGTIANLAPHPIVYTAGKVSALTIDGSGLFGTLNVSAGKLGPVNVTPGPTTGSGVITIGSTPPLTYSNFQAVNITNAADQPLKQISQPIVTTTGDVIVEGKQLSFLVAAFSDPDPFAKATGFVASINWGDGSPSAAGTIAADGLGNFNVSAAHTYATDGSFPVTVTVTDTGASDPLFVGGIPVTVSDTGGGTLTTLPTSVTVNEAVLRASVTNVSAVEGETFNGVVATFNDDNPFPTPTDFSATIDWGDGTTSPGTINRGNDPGNSFIVTGSHVYEDEITGEPPYILRVTISEQDGGASATVQGTATVADARLIPTLIQPAIAAVEGTLFSGSVATFDDLNVNAPLDDFNGPFAPTISWGDGQTSVGTVVKDVIPGRFDVIGSHIYAKDTTLPIPVIVTINDEGGMKATVNNTANVSDPALMAIPVAPITVTVGTPLPAGTVITQFADPNPLAAAGDFRAGINWGDGTTITAGTVQQAGLVFNVTGTHTYTAVGTFKTTVTIVDANREVELVDDPLINVVDAPLTPTGATVFATEQVPFTANVATFTDADPFPDASKFSSKIDWGDDQTSAGTITSYGTSPSGMTFVVSGSHTYNDNGVMNHQITVTIVDSEGSQTVALGQAILGVAAAPTDPQGATFTATEGILSPLGTLATFTDPDPNVQPPDFTVSINWGDGSSTDNSSGVVTVSGTGTGRTFSVSAQHLYAEEGTYPLSVTIADKAGHVTIANSKAVVSDAALALIGEAISAIEGQGFTDSVVATLTDTNPGAAPSDFAGGITIDWGDGSHSEGRVVQTGPGTFNVLGDHTYTEENGPASSPPAPPYTVTVTVLDVGGSRVSTQTQADVEDAQPLVLASTNTGLESIEGQRLSSVTLATFNDPNHYATTSDYRATIDWGDGSPIDTGVVTLTGDNSSGVGTSPAVTVVQVSGSHTYAEESTSYTATVTLVDLDSPDKPVIATVQIPVGDAPLEPEGAPSIPAYPGLSTGVVTVATVLDGDPHPDLSDFSATIDWGDGSATPGSINAVGIGTGQTIYIEGAHTYLLPGDYQIKTFVNDAGGSSTIALAEAVTPGSSVVIVPPPTPDPQGATYTTEEGSFNTGKVATFTDSDPSAVPSDFSVTIDWGDNTGIDTSGTISVSGTGAGQTFTVEGTHVYAELGTYSISVQITDQSGHVGIANSTAVVADAPLFVDTLPPAVANIAATEGQPLSSIEVASFSDANFFSLPSDFEATIDWGDGSPTSAGTITQPGGLFSPFVVSGSHTYAEASATPFVISATIRETDGGTQGLSTAGGQGGSGDQGPGAPTNVQVTVGDAALNTSASMSLNATEGQPLSNVLLATFIDSNPLAKVSEFKATIDWGDGSPIDVGIVHLAGDNTGSPVAVVQVTGSHTYADEGSDDAIVTLIDVDNPSQPVTATVSVTTSDAALVATEKALISAIAGAAVPDNTGGNGALVATFTDGNPLAGASDFQATIAWGDGSSSAGTVTPLGGGVFSVSGTHTFGNAGNFTVTVNIVDQGGSQTITTAAAIVASVPVQPPAAVGAGQARTSATTAVHTKSAHERSPLAQENRRTSASVKHKATIRRSPLATSIKEPVLTVSGAIGAVSDTPKVKTPAPTWLRPFRHFQVAARQQERKRLLEVQEPTPAHRTASSRRSPLRGSRG